MRRETAGGGYGRFLWRDAGWAKCTKNLQKCKARKDRFSNRVNCFKQHVMIMDANSEEARA